MELMPYSHPAALDGHAVEWDSLPAFGLVTPGDWRVEVPVLGGPDLTLRELQHEDAASLCAHLTTEEVTRFISPPPTSVEGFERFIRWTHTRRAEGRFLCFGIVPAGQTRAVGFIQIHLSEPDAETAEWGFVLGAAFWGTGVFQDGARRVVNFAFAHMGLRQLVAHAATPNGRGNGALGKLGAVQTGVRRQSLERHGVRLDQAIWMIERDHWWVPPATEGGLTVH